MGLFKKKTKEVVSERNPMLDVPHEHFWLNANDGLELVCGECGRRQWVSKDKPKPKDYQDVSNP